MTSAQPRVRFGNVTRSTRGGNGEGESLLNFETEYLDDDNDGDGGGGDDKKSGRRSAKRKPCCGPGWQLTGLFWIGVLMLFLFGGLLIGLVTAGPEMHATTQATIEMHDQMMMSRDLVVNMSARMKDSFSADQLQVTTEQIVDTIERVHGIATWVDGVRRHLSPETMASLVTKLDTFLGNVTTLVELVDLMMMPPSSSSGKRAAPASTPSGGVAEFLKSGSRLMGAIDPAEFREAFVSGHKALRSVADLDRAKMRTIVDSASDILSAADSSHIVNVISDMTARATEVLKRFSSPSGGIRLSLPMSPVEPSPRRS